MKALVTIGTMVAMMASTSAYAQSKNAKQQRRAPQTVAVVCGGAWLMDRVISTEPDPHIRAAMLRDYSGVGAYPGWANPGSKTCIR